MRKRLSRRAAARLRRKIISAVSILIAAAAICASLNGNYSKKKNDIDNSEDRTDILSNVCNEVYVDLQREEWNPLSDEVLDANADKNSEGESEETSSDDTNKGDKPYPENGM